MSNEYKEWLKEQTFESLANDNLRIKLELKTTKEENERQHELRLKSESDWDKREKQWVSEAEKAWKSQSSEYAQELEHTIRLRDEQILSLTQQNKQLEEENEKLKECFIPLNQKKYYCSKEVYDILEDTKNEWQRVSQLESERVMEIIKLERENKDLTQQSKQLREALKAISKAHSETVPRIMKYAQQALKGVE